MASLSVGEKCEIVSIFGDNYKTYRETANIFNGRHNKNITHTTVIRIIKNFKNTGSVIYKKKTTKRKATEDKQLEVLQTVVEEPKKTTRKMEQELEISKSTVIRILKKNKYHPYKPCFIHTLEERDFDRRFMFCMWVQGKIEEDPSFLKHVLFSDEATFTSNGVVSSQNCRWWADQNPHFTIETRQQRSFKTNVWCGIFKNRIIGPFFFHHNLSSNDYLEFLNVNISNFLDNITLDIRNKIYYQHDGAPIHSTLQVRNWLDTHFNGKWIGRFSDNPWPPRSPDLTPCDFFLWGYLKEKVYRKRPFENVAHMEETIQNCINEMPPHFIRNTLRELNRRTIKCIEAGGRHVENTI